MATKLEYYQTNEKIVISVFEKNIDESLVKVQCKPKKIRVLHGDKIILSSSLYGEVDDDDFSYVIKPRKIEITLKKIVHQQWPSIEDQQKDKDDAKKVPTDKWSALVREFEEEEKEADDNIQSMFKNIFANADDDVKRAMLKSYTESKGTVLSTNWNEISKKQTPIKPPAGTEFKPLP